MMKPKTNNDKTTQENTVILMASHLKKYLMR